MSTTSRHTDIATLIQPTTFDGWLCLSGKFRDTDELQEWGDISQLVVLQKDYRQFRIKTHGIDPYTDHADHTISEIDRLVHEMQDAQQTASQQTASHQTASHQTASQQTASQQTASQIDDVELNMTIPEGWSEHKDSEDNIYFLHAESDIISYEHPLNLRDNL